MIIFANDLVACVLPTRLVVRALGATHTLGALYERPHSCFCPRVQELSRSIPRSSFCSCAVRRSSVG